MGEPSMRVYEDHELAEFIEDFFSRNRNIYAGVKYTYPFTLEMYSEEGLEEDYRETQTETQPRLEEPRPEEPKEEPKPEEPKEEPKK